MKVSPVAGTRNGPGVHLPPPLLFALVYLAGVGLDRLWPLPRLAGHGLTLVGNFLLVVSVVLGIWGLYSFARAGTTILPFRASRALITGGPFRFTRNPLYLGLALAYAGIALGWGMLWPLLLLPLAVGIITRYVIRAEEAYLDRLFGEDYRAYRRRVRRWLGQRRTARSPLDR